MDAKQDRLDTATSEQNRWYTVLAGALPFFYFGPLVVWLAYPYPYPAWRLEPAFGEGMLAAGLLIVMAGFTIGWLKRFPLWSYPYLCLGAFFFYIGVQLLVSRKLVGPMPVYLLAGALLIGLLITITRRDSPVRDLIRDIGRDWTRLSLGLLILPVLVFAGIDHDEDPVLTLSVIGPTLALLLTAALALTVERKPTRLAILAGGMLLMIVLRLLSGRWFFLLYWLFAVAIVFSPYMIELWAKSGQARPQTGSRS